MAVPVHMLQEAEKGRGHVEEEMRSRHIRFCAASLPTAPMLPCCKASQSLQQIGDTNNDLKLQSYPKRSAPRLIAARGRS